MRVILLLGLLFPSLLCAEMGEQTVVPRVYTQNTCMPAAYPLHCARATVTEYFIRSPKMMTQHFPALSKKIQYRNAPESVDTHYATSSEIKHYFGAEAKRTEYRTLPTEKPSEYRAAAEERMVHYQTMPETVHRYMSASAVQQSYYSKPSVETRYVVVPETTRTHYSISSPIIRAHYPEPNRIYLSKSDRQRQYPSYAPNGYRIRYRLPVELSWRHCVPESTNMSPSSDRR